MIDRTVLCRYCRHDGSDDARVVVHRDERLPQLPVSYREQTVYIRRIVPVRRLVPVEEAVYNRSVYEVYTESKEADHLRFRNRPMMGKVSVWADRNRRLDRNRHLDHRIQHLDRDL